MPEPTAPAPHVLVVVHDPTTDEITVAQADRPGDLPMSHATVVGLLRAAAMKVARDHGINGRDALEQVLRASAAAGPDVLSDVMETLGEALLRQEAAASTHLDGDTYVVGSVPRV